MYNEKPYVNFRNKLVVMLFRDFLKDPMGPKFDLVAGPFATVIQNVLGIALALFHEEESERNEPQIHHL